MQCRSSPAQSRSKRCFSIFCLLSRSHGPNLEPVVEHFSDFLRFCSTFETARSGFGGSGRQKKNHLPRFLSTLRAVHHNFGSAGRQKSGIHPGFCLLSDPRTTILDQAVDKNHTFSPIFVYFWFRAPQFWTRR